MKRPKEPQVADFYLAEQVEKTNAFERCSPKQKRRIKQVQKWSKWKAIQERKGE